MKDATDPTDTVLVPLVGPVGTPLPSGKEQTELVTSLRVESDRIRNGEYTLFDRDTFLEMLRHGYAEHLQNK